MGKFLDKEIENFEIVEECEQEVQAEKRNKRVRQWVGTWNNPKMTDEEFAKWFEDLHDAEIVQYATFQREQGEKTGTIHFQFYVNFRNPQYFKKVKEEYLPQGCHFAPMISTANRCKEYCSKVETRVSGPYEIGEFEKEGQRTDYHSALTMIDEGVPYTTIAEIFPSISSMYERQFKSREELYKTKNFMNKCRNVETTYIYGKPGVRKSGRIYMKYGFENVFHISNYEKYLFHGYERQKVVLFDEFASQIKIMDMDQYLDIYPVRLRCLGSSTPACYEKVIIISNFSPQDQYKMLDEEQRVLREAFFRRLHNIIYVDENGVEHKEKETIFRDLKPEEITLPGLTRGIEKTIYYSRQGMITKIESREKVEQMEFVEISQEEAKELPFDLEEDSESKN